MDSRSRPSDWHLYAGARSGLVCAAGVHSMILTPLIEHGRVLGPLCLYPVRRHATPFDQHDVALAE